MGTIDIANLSAEERLRLLEELWESLSATPEAIPLTNAQREELDRRLDDLDRLRLPISRKHFCGTSASKLVWEKSF